VTGGVAGGAKALVVFRGDGAGPWARLFGREGFRHCFVALRRDGYWITVDGGLGRPEIAVAAGAGFDLARFYREQGFTVVETGVGAERRLLPLRLATCVGLAKWVLGLGWQRALTPYQLYKRLAEGE
jgi:hypothetical protein